MSANQKYTALLSDGTTTVLWASSAVRALQAAKILVQRNRPSGVTVRSVVLGTHKK